MVFPHKVENLISWKGEEGRGSYRNKSCGGGKLKKTEGRDPRVIALRLIKAVSLIFCQVNPYFSLELRPIAN